MNLEMVRQMVDAVSSRLDGLQADYEIHRHDQNEIAGLRERVRQLEELQVRVEVLERRLDEGR